MHRFTTQLLAVETFVDKPPPLYPGAFRLRQQMDAGAHHVETRVELKLGATLSLAVYDIRGRLRERLWQGAADPGVHVIRWSAADLEPGIYFLRLLAGPDGALLRFTVLR
jgi:hypothetical protein